MFYDYHTTKMEERCKLLMESRPFKWIEVKPSDILKFTEEKGRGKSMIWEEDTGNFYDTLFDSMIETLKQYDADPNIDAKQTAYYKKWSQTKNLGETEHRVIQFFELYRSIKEKGFISEMGNFAGGICVEQTGERLDGSHRVGIAHHLGIPKIRVKEFAFMWKDIDEDFIRRKLKAREIGMGPNYYHIDFGGFTNLEGRVHPNYKENTEERWNLFRDIIKSDGKTILDLGCNEGYLSLQCARARAKVYGIDYSYIDGANTNKLIYEFFDKKELQVEFIEGDMAEIVFPEADTVLLLNAIYHVPREKQAQVMEKLKGRRIIMQGNLRKLSEHERFYGITVEDMTELLKIAGCTKFEVIQWKDKPIVIGT